MTRDPSGMPCRDSSLAETARSYSRRVPLYLIGEIKGLKLLILSGGE